MKIISNKKIIERNSKLSFGSALLSPVLIAISAWLFFDSEENLGLSLSLLVVGFIFYQVGITTKRWSRGTDQTLNNVLRRLDDNYTLYHFTTPVSHLLVGPAGIWILAPRYARGIVTFNEKRKRWKLTRSSAGSKVFSVFMEGLGRPDLELVGEAGALDRYLKKHWEYKEHPHVDGAIIFMDDRVEIEADNAPVPTLKVGKLREFIRAQEKESKVSAGVVKKFKAVVSG